MSRRRALALLDLCSGADAREQHFDGERVKEGATEKPSSHRFRSQLLQVTASALPGAITAAVRTASSPTAIRSSA